MARAKRRKDVLRRFAGTRVTADMERWILAWGKKRGMKKAAVVLAGLRLLRARDVLPALGGVLPACSCSPDDRAKDGCRCGAGVGR